MRVDVARYAQVPKSFENFCNSTWLIQNAVKFQTTIVILIRMFKSLLNGAFIFSILGFIGLPTIAQITPDTSLGAEQTTLSPASLIGGGARRGANLFHSFSEFNINEGQRIDFANPAGVDRILARVTGGTRSQILGTLGVLGNADLFLINPNGIVFGANAQLDIRGSFVTSTADRLFFDNGFAFSTAAPQAPPLLTIGVPIGLQIPSTSGSLINRSRTVDATGKTVGLQVPNGKTIAFVGGDISLEGGYLTAESGRVELGSLASGEVRLTPIASGWQLSYPENQSLRDIQLTQASRVTIAGNGNDAIQVQARHVSLSEGSQFDANTTGVLSGGALIVKASESIDLSGLTPDGTLLSGFLAKTGGTGKAGTIDIATRQLRVLDRASISTATENAGDSGNINIRATDLVEVAGSDDAIASNIDTAAQPNSSGNAGNLTIQSAKLIVRDGGQVSTSSFSSGNSGNLTIVATDSVDVSGVNPADTFSSVIAAQSDQTSTGFGGNLSITTRRLTIRDGAFVSASNRGLGRAGNLEINATESVKVSGVSPIVDYPTYLQIDGLGRGGAGDLRITTPFFQVSDGAIVTASSIFGEGGNIIINAGTVLLRRKGQIISDADPSANAFPRPDITIPSTANGGSTIINADNLLLLENSSITANAVRGQGGNVQIRTQSFFQLSGSEIIASSEFGVNGVVDIETPDIDPSRGLVTLPVNLVDASRQITQQCAATTRQNRFAIVGRGGLPTDPVDPLRAESIWQDLQPIESTQASRPSTQSETISPSILETAIVEAQGWVKEPNGTVTLVAQPKIATPGGIKISDRCPTS
jgi:filamentous hemagglutinin family protein